ncbi:hypothetical protein ISS86_01560 [Candidatus Microgenomates bacterium]|nr:hypothetical protein [Candidatus Microgenomates bacterium]
MPELKKDKVLFEKGKIMHQIEKAAQSPLSYRDYRNLITGIRGGGVAGEKLVDSIFERNPDAVVEVPCDLGILEQTYRNAVQALGLRFREKEMRDKLEEEGAHANKAMELGVDRSDISFNLIFLHPHPSRNVTSFIVATQIHKPIAEVVHREVALAPRSPSDSDRAMANREPEIKKMKASKKEPVEMDIPKLIISLDVLNKKQF